LLESFPFGGGRPGGGGDNSILWLSFAHQKPISFISQNYVQWLSNQEVHDQAEVHKCQDYVTETWTQSYDFDLQRQRCKFLQRHG
jgi:hypothetical protein